MFKTISLVIMSLILFTSVLSAQAGFEVNPKPRPEAAPQYEPIARVPVTVGGIMPDKRAVESGLFIRIHKPVMKVIAHVIDRKIDGRGVELDHRLHRQRPDRRRNGNVGEEPQVGELRELRT